VPTSGEPTPSGPCPPPARLSPALGSMIKGGLLLAFAGLCLAGCGQTQVAPAHRDLVLRLATATSTRDAGVLDRAATDIDALARARELSDQEAKAFRAIIDAARADDWDQAQELAYRLRDGQEPTEEDRARVAKRTLREIKKVSSNRGAPR